MLQQNFAYILEKKASLHPADTAIVEGNSLKSYSYRELCSISCQIANTLNERGVAKGDRICCLTGNSAEYIAVLAAAARIGAILCPLNYRLAPVEMLRIVKDAGPKAVIFDGEFSAAAKEICSTNSGLHALYFGEGELKWATRLEEAIAQQPVNGPTIAADSEDYLLMLYTAGSTGTPKGVPLKHSNLFFNAVNWIIDVGITKNDYTLTIIPLFHIGGHMLWTLPHLIVGAKVLLQRRFDPEESLRLISQERVTNTYFIPAMAKMVIALPDWKEYDLESVRFIGAGGEPVPDKITRAFWEKGIPILNSYGLTETSDGTTSIRTFDGSGKATNCIGKPLTLTDIKIVGPNNEEVEVGVEGEIFHRGPSVVDHYWNRPEESAKAFHNGWVRTGDSATRDSDGFIYFLGRKDDMIITGGENVYPSEVESAILSYPKTADVAVIGIPDEKWGQTLKAIIAPKHGFNIAEPEISEYLKAKLSGFKRPRIIEFVESLPKIGSGKLDRVAIKKLFAKR